MKKQIFFTSLICSFLSLQAQKVKFNNDWKFRVDTSNELNEKDLWAKNSVPVRLPHDWSIDLPFDKDSPSGNRGAALRGGLGAYEKTFTLSNADKDKNFFIIFDGVYMNSTVKINGHTLGTRPFGYITFEYNLTPFLKFDGQENKIEVLVENKQPNSRWYSGSGIYRDVWLDKRGSAYVTNWGTYVTTPKVTPSEAEVKIETNINQTKFTEGSVLNTSVYDPSGKLVATKSQPVAKYMGVKTYTDQLTLSQPKRWDVNAPNLYKVVSEIAANGKVLHSYETKFGIRTFHFDKEKGFFLNDKPLKILGANMHHDLGALGAAFNRRAVQRQFEMLKSMGVNGLRGSHNPPDPQWLDLADEMGFVVMNETFDVWTWDKENTPFNYNLYFDNWHKRDISDHVLRDRNHPSVILWSIGNEIPEQGGGTTDTIGRKISRELVKIVKKIDPTRPITSGLNYDQNDNNIYQAHVLDVIGVNYNHRRWKELGTTYFPGNKPYIITENTSALATRGMYDMPSDSIRRWSGFSEQNPGGNKDFSVSAYENASAPWASTNEEALKLFLKYPFLSGMFMWTGFDYLGEPTPYSFPARSSYFGVIDMAGFPKDSYYLYKSIFTKDTVLHILPHWNWTAGQKIDVHVYFNNADTVELYLNNKFLAKKSKSGDDLFVRFNGLTYQPGTLKAVSKLNGKVVKTTEVKTAGEAYQLVAEVDRNTIHSGGDDLSFVKIYVKDKNGNLVPRANNKIDFNISGAGSIAALDNGLQTDLEPFSNKKWRNAFNGCALAIVRGGDEKGEIQLNISSPGLKGTSVKISNQ